MDAVTIAAVAMDTTATLAVRILAVCVVTARVLGARVLVMDERIRGSRVLVRISPSSWLDEKGYRCTMDRHHEATPRDAWREPTGRPHRSEVISLTDNKTDISLFSHRQGPA
jgi:hypothetical protein